jgi:hypothetical protein|uniref:Uncharacterized protein n=1 Tax=viral metagenome TaxID=1070528 RepID=A0A6C0IN79_9ZZZZ
MASKSTKTSVHSIDEKHTAIMNEINHNQEVVIPQLMEEKNQLKEYIRSLNKQQIDEYMETRDKIYALQDDIKQKKQTKKNYYLNNSKYIFDYFEQKKLISTSETSSQHSKVINSFFKIKSNSQDAANLQSAKYVKSKKYYQNYWKNVSNDNYNMQDCIVASDVCLVCNKGEMIPQDEEGILICNNPECAKFITYIIDSSKPNNKDPPNEVSYTAYIRLNHFKEILSQFQAKESTQIPDEVINAIKARIKKERIEDVSSLNYNKMRDILRKLGLNKYFEHIQYINSLFGIKPPVMNEELHETLCVLFIEIQKPWAVHCPANRTNFFNYTYTLYQLCNLLDQTQYLPYIPMMKDREKQLEQDMIWKKVCEDLDWVFCPTV